MAFLTDVFCSALKSGSLSTCSRWAMARRVMSNPIPGPYGFKYHPWCREMMDCNADFTVVSKSSQCGASEVAICRAFHTLLELRSDVLYVLPTGGSAGDFSKARFSSALALSPYLADHFPDINAVGIKRTSFGNTLYIRGAKASGVNLKSVSVGMLVLDEVSEMSAEAIALSLERLSGQMQKRCVAVSTPTVPAHGISKMFAASTQETFNFKCPHCGRYTELIWPDCISIAGDSIHDPRVADSYIKCKECQHGLEQKAKTAFLADGIWVPHGNADKTVSRGFYVNQLYSSTVSAPELVHSYMRGLTDEAACTAFYNSSLGLPYAGSGAQVTDEQLDACYGTHSIDDLPPTNSNSYFTMGVDQGRTMYATIIEWQMGEWDADINSSAIAKLRFFTKFGEEDWYMLGELMRTWQINACVIDADPQINECRNFARRFRGYAWLTRYRGTGGKDMVISDEESGAPMATVDRTNWLSATLNRFKTRRIILPRDLSAEYREHIKALVRTYKKDNTGNPTATYVNTGDDHFAHSLCYSEIALPLGGAKYSGKTLRSLL